MRDHCEWAWSQYIRTAAAIEVEVSLVDEAAVPRYLQLASRAAHLRELGMTYREIGRALGVDHKLALKAVASARDMMYGSPPRRADS
jgi:hypothetical protein